MSTEGAIESILGTFYESLRYQGQRGVRLAYDCVAT